MPKKKIKQPTLHCGFISETLLDNKKKNRLLWCLWHVLWHIELVPQYPVSPMSPIMVRSEALAVISRVVLNKQKRGSESHIAHLSQEALKKRVIFESRRRLYAGDSAFGFEYAAQTGVGTRPTFCPLPHKSVTEIKIIVSG